MTFIDLFSGIGGFRLGMEMAGHECIGFCEYDKFAVASYRAMHNTEGEWYSNDIRELRSNNIPRADCWCFGFPCQDISVAGKQLGFDGKRSSLFFTVTRLIRDTKEEDRPGTLFIENVKNLLSVNGGIDFLKLLIELDEIGYDAEWQVLNSKHFGVPQNRERVFVVGHLRGRSRREVFPVGQSNRGTNEGGTKGTQANISPTIDTRVGAGVHYAPYIIEPKINVVGQLYGTEKEPNPQAGRIYDKEGLSPSLDTCQGGNRMPKVAIPVLTPDRVEKRQNGRRFKEDGEPMFTLTSQDRHGVMIKTGCDFVDKKYKKFIEENGYVPEYFNPYNEAEIKDITPTLSTQCGSITTSASVLQYDGFRIRKLTPKECFRLQGFPDTYFERAAAVNSDSQLYKQAGNSVTVNVIYEIAKRL